MTFIPRKCLVIFSAVPETSEIVIEKMTEVELELVEKEEMSLSEEQVETVLADHRETEEAAVEEMRTQLTGKLVLVFAYRNMTGDIDEGRTSVQSTVIFHAPIFTAMFENLEDLEVKPILTTKTDDVVWNIFPDFGSKKSEEPEAVEE